MDKERLRARPTSLGQRMLPRRRINEHAHGSIPTVIDGLAFGHGLVGVMRIFRFELVPAGVGRVNGSSLLTLPAGRCSLRITPHGAGTDSGVFSKNENKNY